MVCIVAQEADSRMEWTSGKLVDVIAFLLPGFLAAWIFYGITAHPKKSPFERVVQALIFTAIVQGFTPVVRWILEVVGGVYSFGEWTKDVAQLWSAVNAVIVGLVFALFANKDWFHAFLRKLNWTKRTSYPSEWFSAFNHDNRYVILHLVDGRRLQGWPVEWPDLSDGGHFVIAEAEWLLADNQSAALHTVERLLIPATSVEMVEFMKSWDEIKVSKEVLEQVEKSLVELQTKEDENDGKQSTSTTTPKADARAGGNGSATNQSSESTQVTTSTAQK